MKINLSLHRTYLYIAVLALLCPFYAIAASANLNGVPISWSINQDGSFSIHSSSLKIQNFYPQIDGQAIHPTSFKIEKSAAGGKIVYTIEGGKELILQLASDSVSLTLASTLKGFNIAPEYFCPAGAGKIVGADRLFKQGVGFGGPSAIMPIPRAKARVDIHGMHEHVWSYDSYLAGGVISPDNNAIAIGVYDHKRFL